MPSMQAPKCRDKVYTMHKWVRAQESFYSRSQITQRQVSMPAHQITQRQVSILSLEKWPIPELISLPLKTQGLLLLKGAIHPTFLWRLKCNNYHSPPYGQMSPLLPKMVSPNDHLNFLKDIGIDSSSKGI